MGNRPYRLLRRGQDSRLIYRPAPRGPYGRAVILWQASAGMLEPMEERSDP